PATSSPGAPASGGGAFCFCLVMRARKLAEPPAVVHLSECWRQCQPEGAQMLSERSESKDRHRLAPRDRHLAHGHVMPRNRCTTSSTSAGRSSFTACPPPSLS